MRTLDVRVEREVVRIGQTPSKIQSLEQRSFIANECPEPR